MFAPKNNKVKESRKTVDSILTTVVRNYSFYAAGFEQKAAEPSESSVHRINHHPEN